ncbi:glycerol kinase GlpK [Aestuariirhabdus sp. Z084]|uniref:glycerol kinase GlpK n=1 Tax=Aestuariirhabdus haliotis TaxID=2918751 RepID=UPI00201B372C|nr:glycerol kinase GlpK [Aestuariirhabdus haliotis]MCL6416278.1 glycerol kinase GlpK [Aestuariirhabdus haliotis]MCL6420151.1 glycerol kinase GlpK [Aestuariirhabdus haliotis]
MTQYLMAIDQGTTSTRAIIFNTKGVPLWQSQQEFSQIYPNDGWVEHNPQEIWESTLEVCRQVLKKGHLEASDVAGIGITNQRETTIVWERESGQPIYNAIVWQDRRTAKQCELLKRQGHEDRVAEKTGLLLDPYFSATKTAWILDHVEGARERAERGELMFGTVDSFLLWRLTGGRSHKTDATNASRTLMFDIHRQQWDPELLELFQVPAAMLPEVEDCSADFGATDKALFGSEIPIVAIAGDQQAALVGQACFQPGMAKSTYGTGCFLILNTGDKAVRSNNRLLTTVGYRLNGKVSYAVEGSIFVAGAAVQWLRDGIRLIPHASVTEALAKEARDSSVYLVPAFTGLGAPYWDPNARGAIMGLTRDSGIPEIVAAGLQSVCYQTRDLMLAMQADGAQKPETLRVDGGMVVNNWLVQFLADMLDARVERPEVTETTALGVAYLAGLQLGIYDSLESISKLWYGDRSFEVNMDAERRESLYKGWLDAVARVSSEIPGK